MSGVTSVPILIDGDPQHFPVETVTTPGVQQTLLSIVVPVGISRDIWALVISCCFEGQFKISVDGSLIGSGRTGAAKPNANFSWVPQQNAGPGQNILVTFQSRENSPVAPIEGFLMCADIVTS